MPQDELKKRIAKLELDLREAQRRLVVQDADLAAKNKALAQQEKQLKTLESNRTELADEIKVMRKQVAEELNT